MQVKIIAAILERAVIGKILTHLGLDPQPLPRSKAREAALEFAAREAGAYAGTRPVACSGWRAAWGMLRAMCARCARDVRATCPSAPPSPRARPESHAVNACSPIAGTARCDKRVSFAPFSRPGSDEILE